jgi:hypothetical protein
MKFAAPDQTKRFGLSKSRLTSLDQCERKLWLSVHRRDLAERNEGAEQRIAVGHQVGAIACDLVLGGVMIDDVDLGAAAEHTSDLIRTGQRVPLFEATFVHDGVLVRVDVLEPVGEGAWAIVEVKSTTGVKDYHLADVATQVWVLQQCGLDVAEASIRHIDNQFVLREAGDYRGLLKDRAVLAGVEATVTSVGARVDRAREVLAGPEPDVSTGGHCGAPFACEFVAYCSRFEPDPPEWPVGFLPRTGKALAARFAEQGVFDLRDVPEAGLANPVHKRVHAATITDCAYHDHEGAAAAVAGWAWPRAFLDFETIALAVPRWIGTRPYQAVPFQFSCHFEQEDGTLDHLGFLSLDGDDPRRACAEAVVSALGDHHGAVVAYNASFERGCVQGLADAFPDLAPPLLAIRDRIVDLLPVTRGHYYHRDQRGSWSIKAVLPTVAPELAYDGLDVADGVAAQLAWMEAIAEGVGSSRRQAIRVALETYCARDTEAMVVLLQRLTAPRQACDRHD